MRVEGKTKSTTARALTNPRPSFVSLVKAGANLTPFVVTKAEGEEDMTTAIPRRRRVVKTTSEDALGHPLKAVKTEGVAIAAISFSKSDAFKDEGDVKNWLDDGGYTDYEIAATDKGWSVVNKSDEFEGALKTVSVTAQVDVSLGTVKKAEAEEVNPGATSESTEAKEEVTSESAGNEASSAAEPELATEAAAPNSEAKTEEVAQKSVYQIIEMAEAIQCLNWLASDRAWAEQWADKDPVLSTKLKALCAELLGVLGELAVEEAKEILTPTQKSEKADMTDKSTAATADDTNKDATADADTAAAAGATETKTEAAAPAADAAPDAATAPAGFDLEAILRTVMAPVTEAVASVSKAVEALSTEVKANKAETDQKVEALGSQRQTKKGAGVDDSPSATAASTVKSTKAEEDAKIVDQLAMRGIFGR